MLVGAQAMAPMSYIGGGSVFEVLHGLLAGTPLGDRIKTFMAEKQQSK